MGRLLILSALLALAGCAPLPDRAAEMPPSRAAAMARATRSVPIRDRFARARLQLLRAVNAERTALGLAPVILDSLATLAAQRHAESMATGGFYSHYDRAGRAPYERLAALGGTDHVIENVFRWEERDQDPLLEDDPWRRFEPEAAHAALMASAPHRAAILDPHRTGVGLGFAVAGPTSWGLSGRAVFVVEEFVARHATLAVQRAAAPGRPVRVAGRVLAAGMRPLAVVLRREPWQRSWPAGEPPPGPYDDGGGEPHVLPPWSFATRADGTFAFTLSGDLPPGRYYAVLYVAPGREVELALARRRAYPSQGWPGAAFIFDVEEPGTPLRPALR